MNHHSAALDAVTGAGAIALNIITWGGFIDAMKGLQVVVTMVVSLAVLVYHVYGIAERHKNINRK